MTHIANPLTNIARGIEELSVMVSLAQPGVKPVLMKDYPVDFTDPMRSLVGAHDEATKYAMESVAGTLFRHMPSPPTGVQPQPVSLPAWWPEVFEGPYAHGKDKVPPQEVCFIYATTQVIQVRLNIKLVTDRAVYSADECCCVASVYLFYILKGALELQSVLGNEGIEDEVKRHLCQQILSSHSSDFDVQLLQPWTTEAEQSQP